MRAMRLFLEIDATDLSFSLSRSRISWYTLSFLLPHTRYRQFKYIKNVSWLSLCCLIFFSLFFSLAISIFFFIFLLRYDEISWKLG